MTETRSKRGSREGGIWCVTFVLFVFFVCLPTWVWAARPTVAPTIVLTGPTVTKLRIGTYPTYTRVVLETSVPVEWSVLEDVPEAVRIVVPGGVLAPDIQVLEPRKGILRAIQPTQRPGGVEVRLLSHQQRIKVHAFSLSDPDRIVVDVLVGPAGEANKAQTQGESNLAPRLTQNPALSIPPVPSVPPLENRAASIPAVVHEATAKGRNGQMPAQTQGSGRELPRRDSSIMGRGTGAESLTVVLDPGHGGHDTGAVGPTGLMEKDVVLDLALRLRRLLQERLGMRVIMTRDKDVFVPLQERSAIANRAKADFYVSLHVNGSSRRGAVGFETFYFTREPSDSDARASAQRENLLIDRDGTTGRDQESLLRITLADLAVTRDIRESGELAELALGSLDKILRVENRGVKSGPFYVLATVAMPAVLVESAFITNPNEERKLQRDAYRQRIAEALCEGIGKFKARYERRVGLRGDPSAATGS
ncbi:MAG TPA: N-acetylmuramoyl-L-alanine amidase [Candidatus Methylomirabilis sp.]|nr:N-acetylmuramoyl-L-alanine amidase [Candidatus Methylomirabilis sp.]